MTQVSTLTNFMPNETKVVRVKFLCYKLLWSYWQPWLRLLACSQCMAVIFTREYVEWHK